MGTEEESTRYELSRVKAPEERGRRAQSGEPVVGVPELTRALAIHYTSLTQVITLKSNMHSAELCAVLGELRDANQRLSVLAESLSFVVRRTLEHRRRRESWWRDPTMVAAAATWLLAGCVLGALMNRP